MHVAGWFHTDSKWKKKETDNNNKLYTLESAGKAPNRIDEIYIYIYMHWDQLKLSCTALGEDQKPSFKN